MAVEARGSMLPSMRPFIHSERPEDDRSRGAVKLAESVRVVVVDDHTADRSDDCRDAGAEDDEQGRARDHALRLAALGLVGGIDLVARVVDRHGLIRVLEKSAIDVVVIAIGSGLFETGLGVLRGLAARRGHPPVVVLANDAEAPEIDDALALGAVGVVVASSSLEEIGDAIRWASTGGAYLHPCVARSVLERQFGPGVKPISRPDLSRRQLELLLALGSGLTNKEIALRLNLAPGTVNDYMKQLFSRLGVETRAAAVGVGMRRGLIG
jgi:DNA-binding NarL/FixJ family response regulator